MSETVESTTHSAVLPTPSGEVVFKLINQIGMALEIAVDPSDILLDGHTFGENSTDVFRQLKASAAQAGIFLKEVLLEDLDEAIAFVHEGFPLVVAKSDGSFVVADGLSGRKVETTVIGDQIRSQAIARGELRELIWDEPPPRVLVAKKQLDCDSVSAAPHHEIRGHHGEHPSPLRRFVGLLRMERGDVWTVILFAFVAGVLTLATPLAVESLVNVVSWGTYVQPLIVLGLILLTCLGIAGVLKVLQTFVVELIQRRQFVRIVSDLAHRFPRAKQSAIEAEYPRELANRVFDIMTIQKATAVLLLDGMSIVLTTLIGMVLLAFYHPFLLGFDIVLLISMTGITLMLGRGGTRTAIDESISKYRVAHWLQDVIASPTVFKVGGGETLAVQRANQLTAEYITARRRQFNVVIRQIIFAISLQAIASTALLALGGWLVIQGQLTLGQLVASELVVTVVVGAFAKAGKSIEKFYDLMAGVDKVGHLIDIPTDPRHELGEIPGEPVTVRWRDLHFQRAASSSHIDAATIDAGSCVAIVGDDVDGRSDLARTLTGLVRPTKGVVQVGDFDSSQATIASEGRLVGYGGGGDIFCGTLRENVDLGRPGIGQDRVRQVLSQVGMWDAILQLKDGLQTRLQTGGFPLSEGQVAQLIIARAIAARPRLVVIDGLLDKLGGTIREQVWSTLTAEDAPWTLIVCTSCEDVAARCDSQIFIRRLSA